MARQRLRGATLADHQYEEVYLRAHASVSEARESIGTCIGLDNTFRHRSSIDRKTPDQDYFNKSMPEALAA